MAREKNPWNAEAEQALDRRHQARLNEVFGSARAFPWGEISAGSASICFRFKE